LIYIFIIVVIEYLEIHKNLIFTESYGNFASTGKMLKKIPIVEK
jgi:hypothetical protein